MTSMAPAASASILAADPDCVTELTMMTGSGWCSIILRRKVRPSMRGISISSVTTSGCVLQDQVARHERIGGEADHLHVRLVLERVGEHLPDDGRIVHDEHTSLRRWPQSCRSRPSWTPRSQRRRLERHVHGASAGRRSRRAAELPPAPPVRARRPDDRAAQARRSAGSPRGSATRRTPCWRTHRPGRGSDRAPAPAPPGRGRGTRRRGAGERPRAAARHRPGERSHRRSRTVDDSQPPARCRRAPANALAVARHRPRQKKLLFGDAAGPPRRSRRQTQARSARQAASSADFRERHLECTSGLNGFSR